MKSAGSSYCDFFFINKNFQFGTEDEDVFKVWQDSLGCHGERAAQNWRGRAHI